MYVTNFYNAALIKFKQKDFNKSAEHFNQFFKGIQPFCSTFLDDKSYQNLDAQGVFAEVSMSNPDCNQMKQYLERSQKIFTAIYGPTHSIVKDYVVVFGSS